MVIGVCIPRPVDLKRAGGLAGIGVAQVRRNAAVLSLELLDRVKGTAAGQAGDRRIQSPAGDEQQRKAGTGVLVVNANVAFFVKGHGSSSLDQPAEQTSAALRPSPLPRRPLTVQCVWSNP